MKPDCLQGQLTTEEERLKDAGVFDGMHSSYSVNLVDRIECGGFCSWEVFIGGVCVDQAMKECPAVSSEGCTSASQLCGDELGIAAGCPFAKG